MSVPKGFNRNFEKTFGHLTPEQFPAIDWGNREQLELLFPSYKREMIHVEKLKGPPPSKVVEIKGFDLKTPTKDKDIFVNASLTIGANQRAAVYGENGSGKTMLFSAIANGELNGFPKWKSVHHMQEMSHDPAADDVTVMDTVVSSHPLGRVLKCMDTHLQALLKEEKSKFDVDGMKANLKYVKDLLESIDYGNAEEEVSKDLRVLGFDEVGEQAPMSSLSGGLRMRVALAAAFFIKPELLLLDEPTNHLDLPSVLWLENKLRGYKNSFLVVTHDRHLLENTVRGVMQLTDLKIKMWNCGFAEFEKSKVEEDVNTSKKIERYLKQNQNIDPMSPEYKTKIRYQAWQAKIMRRQVAMAGKFTFKNAPPLKAPAGVEQKDVSLIKIDNVRFSYDEAKGLPFIFDTPVNYEIKMGTRVGVMGPNGAGKSTFLKLVTEKIFPTSGTITRNGQFKLAYFGQHSTKELKMEDTPLDFMTASFPKANKGEITTHLEKTTVDRNLQNTRMSNLSFSQRSCVIFAKLTFVPPHLLIMDEPTNFLDLDSVDALISAAKKFQGALITVTHNRDFLKRTSSDFLSLVPGAFIQFDSMKDAERATYSFIDALEKGEDVDHKTAIQENRGGGAVHTEEYLASQENRRRKIQEAADKANALAQAAAKEAEEKAKKAEELKAARAAAKKTDWVAGDECWAPIKGGKAGAAWALCVVKRNIPSMGCTVTLPDGKSLLLDAKKLKTENPELSKKDKAAGLTAPPPQAKAGKGGKGGKGKSKAGGKGGKGGAKGKGKGKGTVKGGRGG